jgi:hypothetical protein
MTDTTCGSPAAKKLGCTCPPPEIVDGKQRAFIQLSCPVHSPFHEPKEG